MIMVYSLCKCGVVYSEANAGANAIHNITGHQSSLIYLEITRQKNLLFCPFTFDEACISLLVSTQTFTEINAFLWFSRAAVMKSRPTPVCVCVCLAQPLSARIPAVCSFLQYRSGNQPLISNAKTRIIAQTSHWKVPSPALQYILIKLYPFTERQASNLQQNRSILVEAPWIHDSTCSHLSNTVLETLTAALRSLRHGPIYINPRD